MSETRSRRGYLDLMRGLAVLIMIEAHVLDSWTRFPDRQTRQFAYAMVLGGFGAPLFLFLAGVAVPLSAGSKFRRTGDRSAASRAVSRRGLEVFGLAFLFRLQAWVLGWSAARSLLKVDILNIMGPSIMAAAAIWGARTTVKGRLLAFSAAMLAVTFLSPIVRTTSILAALPDPIEAYLRPVGGLSNFVFFPWAGFVFAGAIAGLILDGAWLTGQIAGEEVAKGPFADEADAGAVFARMHRQSGATSQRTHFGLVQVAEGEQRLVQTFAGNIAEKIGLVLVLVPRAQQQALARRRVVASGHEFST